MSNRRIRRKRARRAIDELQAAAARGVDLAALRANLALSPLERVQANDALLAAIEQVRARGDAVLAAMQTPEHRAALDRALAATGEQLGRAAVNAAFDAAVRAVWVRRSRAGPRRR